MEIEFKNKKVKDQCTLLRQAKRYFPEKVAIKLLRLINFIESAENLTSLINYKKYYFHPLKGNKKELYALDIDGRKSGYRLIVSFNSFFGEDIYKESLLIERIEIEEVSNHYG